MNFSGRRKCNWLVLSLRLVLLSRNLFLQFAAIPPSSVSPIKDNAHSWPGHCTQLGVLGSTAVLSRNLQLCSPLQGSSSQSSSPPSTPQVRPIQISPLCPRVPRRSSPGPHPHSIPSASFWLCGPLLPGALPSQNVYKKRLS